MSVLPWPGRDWDIDIVPCAEPGTTQATFPAIWNGTRVLATATASDNTVTIEPLADVRLEVPLAVWMKLGPAMTVHALAHTKPLPPAA